MPKSREMWLRACIIANAAWFLIVLLISANSRDFEWFPGHYWNLSDSILHAGPAFLTWLFGAALICVIAFGAPWILQANSGK